MSPPPSAPAIETLTTPTESDFAALCALLRDAVEGGASVGYLVPVRDAELHAFWTDTFAEVRAGRRLVLAVRDAGHLVGSAQLALAAKPNSLHRAEVQKLLVLRTHRARGLGTALLHAVETAARAHRRTLLVLDTSSTGNALGLYSRSGYTSAGTIPRYAADPDGSLIDTVIYYKHLAP